MFKKIVSLYLWVYIVLGVIVAHAWDWHEMAYRRERYLLGIFYNNHFKDFRDGIVYFDFLNRQKPNDKDTLMKLAYCYGQLGDTRMQQTIEERIRALK